MRDASGTQSRSPRKTLLCAVARWAVALCVSFGSFGVGFGSAANAISRGLTHEGFGIELAQVCDAAELQFSGVDALNDSDSDAGMYLYFKDISRVLTNFEARLKKLKTTDPVDAKVLQDLRTLVVKEHVFIIKIIVLAKAKRYEEVRNRLNVEGQKFDELELVISNRLVNSGLPGCSVLFQPDGPTDEGQTGAGKTDAGPAGGATSVSTTTISRPLVAMEDLSRFFAPVGGYTYLRPSEKQEKSAAATVADSIDFSAFSVRPIIGPDSRIFGQLSVLKFKAGLLDATYKKIYLDDIFGFRSKRETLGPFGTFIEVYSANFDGTDSVVIFQGDYLMHVAALPTANRKASKDFAATLLTTLNTVVSPVDALASTTTTTTTPTSTTGVPPVATGPTTTLPTTSTTVAPKPA